MAIPSRAHRALRVASRCASCVDKAFEAVKNVQYSPEITFFRLLFTTVVGGETTYRTSITVLGVLFSLALALSLVLCCVCFVLCFVKFSFENMHAVSGFLTLAVWDVTKQMQLYNVTFLGCTRPYAVMQVAPPSRGLCKARPHRARRFDASASASEFRFAFSKTVCMLSMSCQDTNHPQYGNSNRIYQVQLCTQTRTHSVFPGLFCLSTGGVWPGYNSCRKWVSPRPLR